jgi:hypothetical protein
MNILDKIDKIDLILYDSIFDKYIECTKYIEKIIYSINNTNTKNTDYINYPEYFIIQDENNNLSYIITKLNELIINFNNYSQEQLDKNDVIEITIQINCITGLLKDNKNHNLVIDLIDRLNNIINNNRINIKYTDIICNYKDDTDFLLDFIDKNY